MIPCSRIRYANLYRCWSSNICGHGEFEGKCHRCHVHVLKILLVSSEIAIRVDVTRLRDRVVSPHRAIRVPVLDIKCIDDAPQRGRYRVQMSNNSSTQILVKEDLDLVLLRCPLLGLLITNSISAEADETLRSTSNIDQIAKRHFNT